MKIRVIALATVLALPAAHAQSKATAEWIPEYETVEPGQPFRTVIRLTVEEGWHTYWENPGEGGLPIKATGDLPEGWTLGKIQFPAPIAFKTGPLHGFGYEGEILFPLTITPPAGSNVTELPEEIVPIFSWLTCNDQSCVPGKAEPTLAAANPALVEKAYADLPIPVPGARLEITDKAESLKLLLTLPPSWTVDISNFKVFPVTRNLIDPAAQLRFKKSANAPNTWQFSAPKSEYQDGEITNLEIVLVESSGKAWIAATPAKMD